jgi:hypothetical protein
MYLRTTPRRNSDGSVVRYLQLAHNTWDPQAKRSRVQVVYNFGREDHHNRAALQRLVASVTRFLDPDQTLAAQAGEGLGFVESRPLGGTWVLDGLWRRLGIDQTMRRLLKGRRLDPLAERVLFGLVANRALAPSSKLAAAHWISDDAAIPGLAATSDDACYRAMDWLLEIHHELEQEVFGQVATLLDLEVDLLFFDPTSTYFELEEPDTPIARDPRGLPLPQAGDGNGQDDNDAATTAGFRSYGHSKDHRDDLPQVVSTSLARSRPPAATSAAACSTDHRTDHSQGRPDPLAMQMCRPRLAGRVMAGRLGSHSACHSTWRTGPNENTPAGRPTRPELQREHAPVRHGRSAAVF